MELVSYAFAAGALATLNPCGFSLLPAALGRFLANRRRGGSAGLAVGLLMGLGVFATFAGVGALVALIGTAVGAYLPYVNSLLGVGLIALGFRSLLGRPPSLAIRGPAGREGSLAEFVLFGIAYGLASLGCTLPVFLAVAGLALSRGPGGLAVLLAYGLGMAGVLAAVGWVVGMGKEGVLRGLRLAGRGFAWLGGVLLLLAGSYLLGFQLDFLLGLRQLTWGLPLAAGFVAWFVGRWRAFHPA
ncbi:cytochrome c biogenesis CcdA family protein [Oceanithermus sp.]